MKNLTKLLGIIALAVVMGLSLTGCPDGNNLIRANLTGSVSLDKNAPIVGDTITAAYAPGNGSGVQTWQWFRADGTDDLIPGAAASTYTTTAADLGKKIKVQLSFADQNGSVSKTTTYAVAAAPSGDITYTATRADGKDGTADTTAINFTFSASVTGLTENDITVTDGTGSVTTGTLSGSGTSWTLGVTVTAAGNVTVSISKSGIEAVTKDVIVYKAGETAPTAITYTVTQTGGTDGTADTTGIAFTFSESVAGLTANDITITDGTGAVTKGALSGSGTSWSLAITVTTAGNLTIAIAKTGIEAAPKDVTVYKAGETAPTLNSITAVYTQGSTIVYPTTSLDSLKANLTVTAAYSNSTTQPVTAFALSGTLTVGTSTVTVTFEGKTTTFTVTVTAAPIAKTLTDITLNTDSVQKDYYYYEKLNLSGLVVTANYSDSTSAVVTNYTSDPANNQDLTYTGTRTVTVWYTEGGVTRTTSFTVTVNGDFDFYAIGNPVNAYYVKARYGSTLSGELHIPSTYNGLPVTGIGSGISGDSGAFTGRTSITSITIPASVTSISNNAFYNCTSLTTVTIAEDSQLEAIGDRAFYNCTSITSITIPESVTSMGINVFSDWTNSQTIYVEGYANQTAAEAAWGTNWPGSYSVVVVYLGGMSSIAITQQPSRTVYPIGGQLNITGLVVTATYDDNSTRTVTITAANITGFDSTTAGPKTLTVTYIGKTATFTVTVIDPNFTVTNTTEWNDAINTIKNNGDDWSYTITVNGDVGVAGNSTNPLVNTFGSVSNLTVTLNGSGKLYLTSEGYLIVFGYSSRRQTLIIDSPNLTLQGLTLNSRPSVYVGSQGTLELKNGTISGNTNDGGTLAETYGGGVALWGGTFTMSGGTISGNTARSYDKAYGGGVYVSDSSTFTMSGGTIYGNTTTEGTNNGYAIQAYGGGVYVKGSSGYPATFTMTGGTISGNTVSAPTMNSSAYGGGVCVGSYGIFRIVTGTVTNNTATGYNSYSAQGAALYTSGTSQRGTFSGETWTSKGNLSTSNTAINVLNGDLQ